MKIKRILVAVDASSHSLAALASAADLAEKLQVELHGIFIEDINLLRLAQLPFAREFQYSRPFSQKLDMPQMAEQLRLQGALARRHFDTLAEKHHLNHSFQVRHGSIPHELQAVSQETDLLILGRISRSLLHTTRLGSTAKTAVSSPKQSLFLTHAAADLSRPILLIYDGSESAEEALSVAVHLGGQNGRYNILISADGNYQAQLLKEHLDRFFQTFAIKGSFRRLHQINLEEIQHILHMTQSGILILSHDNTQLTPSLTRKLLETIDCPILLIK